MITHSKILSDLEMIYEMSISDGNLALAIKAKELQSKQIEFINKNENKTQPLQGIKIDNLIKLAQKYMKIKKHKS